MGSQNRKIPRKQRHVFLFSVIALNLPLSYTPVKPKELLLGLGGSYSITSSNFDSTGNQASLINGNELQSIEGHLYGEYGFGSETTFFTDLSMASNTVTAFPQDSSGVLSQTRTSVSSSGVKDLIVGLRYNANPSPVRLSIDGSVLVPLYSRLNTTEYSRFSSLSTIPLGDGGTEIGLFGRGELPVSENFYLGLGLGYTLRTQNFSDLLPATFYIKYDNPRSFFARFGLFAQYTADRDLFDGRTSNDRSSVLLGGSQKINAVNPRFYKIDTAAGVYLSESVFASGGFQYEVAGANTSVGPTFLAMLGIDLASSSSKEKYESSNRGFVQYSFDAQIIQANNQLKQVLINKGRSDGVRKGEYLDVFMPNPELGRTGAAIARAQVVEAGPTRSKLTILEFFKRKGPNGDKPIVIQEGFVVRRPVN